MLVEERHSKINKINENVAQLEEVEKLLVEKLGMTQMNQHQALANLHKVVQICNSGIDLKNFKRDNSAFDKGANRLQNLNTNSSILNPGNNEIVPVNNQEVIASKLNKSSTRQFDESALQFQSDKDIQQSPELK